MTDQLLRRFFSIRAEDVADNGDINLIISTDAPCDFGGYREILRHGEGAVNTAACKSLLLNHDRDQIIGGVRSIEVGPNSATAKVTIAESARTVAGTNVRELVKSGALQGVSIGYQTDATRSTYDKETNTVTRDSWQLREITLTPTAADTDAHVVRSLPDQFREISVSKPAANPAALPKGSPMADEIKPQDPLAGNKDEAVRAAEIKTLRERAVEVDKITKLAETHGLRASEFTNKSYADAIEAMLASKAESERSAVKSGIQVQVTRDQQDKVDERAADDMFALRDSTFMDDKGLPVFKKSGARSSLDILRQYARASGINEELNKFDLAAMALGKRVPGMSLSGRSAANVTSSNFNSVVLASIMDKAVFNGFNNFGSQVTYPIWTKRRTVADFKQFSAGALDTGNLVSTLENQAFPELTKAEGYYNGTLGLSGATVSLTLQALVNDDMGEFMAILARAGAIAQRTIDEQVYTALEALTWTGNKTSALTSLATAGSLDLVRVAFETKNGPAGKKVGNKPRFLIVPSVLRTPALQFTTQVQAYPTLTNVNTDLQAVVTPYLTQAATAANSTFYLAGDSALVDTVTVAFLQGAETPMVMEYDAGAVAKRSWKIMQAFVAVGASTTVGGTIYIPGMQQGLT